MISIIGWSIMVARLPDVCRKDIGRGLFRAEGVLAAPRRVM